MIQPKHFWQVFLLLGICALVTTPATASFVSYNDCVGPTNQSNVTQFSGYLGGGGGFETTSGELVNFSDGTGTGVNVTMEAWNISESLSAMVNSGTDAYAAFHNVFNNGGTDNSFGGSASYNSSSIDWYYQVTFSGLDPNKTYAFATTGNRDGSSYAAGNSGSRWGKFRIEGADSYTNDSTAGVLVYSPAEVLVNTGYNKVSGHIASWRAIDPGSDGTFTVVSENPGRNRDDDFYATLIGDSDYEEIKGYGMQVFRLMEDSAQVPVPAAVWLLGSGIVGLVVVRRRSAR
jgi:hypothetical protein